jgi:hypothetical protein
MYEPIEGSNNTSDGADSGNLDPGVSRTVPRPSAGVELKSETADTITPMIGKKMFTSALKDNFNFLQEQYRRPFLDERHELPQSFLSNSSLQHWAV